MKWIVYKDLRESNLKQEIEISVNPNKIVMMKTVPYKNDKKLLYLYLDNMMITVPIVIDKNESLENITNLFIEMTKKINKES